MRPRKLKAFTIVELLIVSAVLLIIAGVAVPFSVKVKNQFKLKDTKALLTVLADAVERYQNARGDVPFTTLDDSGNIRLPQPDELKEIIEAEISGSPEADGGAVTLLPEPSVHNSFAGSEALYFILSRCPDSAKFLEEISSDMITAKYDGQTLKAAYAGKEYILPRITDSWGNAIRYYYKAEWTFPRIVSAGPDCEFDTEDDISNF
ncbi:type II secretion system protein G [Sedimentisphaera cyanobacteriorum]|uniref:Type II secretion system protein G n=1 Tax=Sedimentisphaera cyanobacteriorum TaxID=1940790 RepID=A0A1Q2HPS1_9BACT|nr:type II secretion system protein [Sedimentisphaera cyanobacteriorum]AQQ09447.1 type II secretion system protein G [Sedimentisphaera cyanobacteriorum]